MRTFVLLDLVSSKSGKSSYVTFVDTSTMRVLRRRYSLKSLRVEVSIFTTKYGEPCVLESRWELVRGNSRIFIPERFRYDITKPICTLPINFINKSF